MKAPSQHKFLLTVALAALASLEAAAQNPAAGVAPSVTAAATRAGAGPAQQDQIENEKGRKRQEQARKDGNAGTDANKPGPFTFSPPQTKTRLGRSKDEQERRNELGAELVSFVDEAENIGTNRNELV